MFAHLKAHPRFFFPQTQTADHKPTSPTETSSPLSTSSFSSGIEFKITPGLFRIKNEDLTPIALPGTEKLCAPANQIKALSKLRGSIEWKGDLVPEEVIKLAAQAPDKQSFRYAGHIYSKPPTNLETKTPFSNARHLFSKAPDPRQLWTSQQDATSEVERLLTEDSNLLHQYLTRLETLDLSTSNRSDLLPCWLKSFDDSIANGDKLSDWKNDLTTLIPGQSSWKLEIKPREDRSGLEIYLSTGRAQKGQKQLVKVAEFNQSI